MGTMFDMVEEEGRSNMRSFSAGKRTGTLLSVVAAIAVQGACGSSSVTPSADAEMAADATAAADVTTVPDTTIETSTGINAVTGPATVGFLMPATGSLADQAVVWVAAVQLAQTEINAAGGLMDGRWSWTSRTRKWTMPPQRHSPRPFWTMRMPRSCSLRTGLPL